jgi:PKD repeat protein
LVLGPGIAVAGDDEPMALTPVIGLEPAALNFAPCLAPGECVTLTFDIFNAVNDPESRLEVTSVEMVAAQFTFIDPPVLPLTIPGDGTRVTFTILFCANGNPAIGVVIVQAANAPNSPSHVSLSGDGNFPPECDAGGPYAGLVGVPITFDGTQTHDPDIGQLTYAWDFGDGATGTGVLSQHAYTSIGTYLVTLNVEDDCHIASACTAFAAIGVGNVPPVCDAGGPYAALVAEAITFDGTGSSDPDGTIVSYTWDFGDGRSGSGPAPVHSYQAPLTYTVVLRVRDDLGALSTCQTLAIVTTANAPPLCDAGGPYLGRAGLAIPFDGSGSHDPDGTITQYAWEFGDGATGQGVAPLHVYADPGSYLVGLCVTDNRGAESCCTTEALIGPGSTPLTPVIGIHPEPLDFGACIPAGGAGDLTFEVFNAVFDPLSILTVTALDVAGARFALAGGPPLPVTIPGDGTRIPFTLRFTPESIEQVTGTLTASAPGAANTPLLVPIQGRGNMPPHCEAGGPYSGLAGEPIHFDGTQSSDPGGTSLTYTWHFGDGTTALGSQPNHVYAAHGTYEVELDVTDNCAVVTHCTTSATVRAAPICDAGGPYFGLPNFPIQFDGRGSQDPDGTIVDYTWDFGDGFSGTGPTPTHTYFATGGWVVTLAVRDNDGFTRSCHTIVDTGAVPVAGVDSLAAEVRGTEVLLWWRTTQTPDLLGFEVWRARTTEASVRLDRDLVRDDDADGRLSFLDRHAAGGERLVYELFAVGRGGEREQAGSLAVDIPALALALHTPRPHPARLPIEIPFDLPYGGPARARVVGAGGRIVAEILDADLPAGRHLLSWSGRDTRGGTAPAGVYLVVLEFGGETRREKLVVAW